MMEERSKIRVLVTGARGFIGRNMVEAASAAGFSTIAACRKPIRADELQLDVTDTQSIRKALKAARPTHVVNCAAYGVDYREQDEESALNVNLHGALQVLRVSADLDVQHVLQIGSCSEYGSRDGVIVESDELCPTAIYGATKAAATVVMRERAAAFSLPLTVARLFGTWGPGEASFRLVPQVLASCQARIPLSLTPCDVLRDYSYVEDAVTCMLALLMKNPGRSGRVVNVGSGKPMLLRDFVIEIARRFDCEDLMHFGRLPHRPTEMRSLVPDVSRLRSVIGEIPVTSLDEGLRRMASYSVPA